MFADELPEKRNLRVADVTSSIPPSLGHGSSVTESSFERKLLVVLVSLQVLVHSAPHGRCLCVRVARRQQQLRLIRFQRARRSVAARPPRKSSFRKTLLREHEALPVVLQYLDGRRAPAAE